MVDKKNAHLYVLCRQSSGLIYLRISNLSMRTIKVLSTIPYVDPHGREPKPKPEQESYLT